MLDHDRPRHTPGHRVEILDGEALLFHPATAQIAHLNRSAALVWQLCDGRHTVGEICTLLGTAYPDAAGSIPEDVRQTLVRLLAIGALAVADEGTDERSVD